MSDTQHPIQLRLKTGETSEGDLTLSVQEKTFDYLCTTDSKEIRISAYLDQDWPMVQARYDEVVVKEGKSYRVVRMSPGSRSRKVELPGDMKSGEQLTIEVIPFAD